MKTLALLAFADSICILETSAMKKLVIITDSGESSSAVIAFEEIGERKKLGELRGQRQLLFL